MKKLFIISALIIASLCSCIKGSKLVILAAEEDEGNSFFTESDRTEPTLYDMGDGNLNQAALDLAARYGSIDNFLEQELGLTADEKRILRDKFLENR